MNTQRLGLAVLLLAMLAACTPTRVVPRLAVPEVLGWQQGPAGAGERDPAGLADWWRGFHDPELDRLIDEAIAANHDLRIAKARVREALQGVTMAKSALYPSLDFNANGGREQSLDRVFAAPGPGGIELIAPAGNAFTGGLSAQWEIDLFGARRLDAEAAEAQAAGAVEGERAVLVGLLAQVATNYLEWRGIHARIAIVREQVANETERLRVVRALQQAGLARDFDSARQATQLHGIEAALPSLTAAAEQRVHRIGVLCGRPPEQLAGRLLATAALPESAPALPALLPASLLDQRPDLRLAKTRVDAAAASLGSAKAAQYPKLMLSVSGGFGAIASGGFSSLAQGVYALGSGLSAPLFNAGRIRAQIAAADARLDQAAADYEKTFLLALEDVENAFVLQRSSVDRRERLRLAEVMAQRATVEADALFRRGATDLLAVIDAQRTRLQVIDQRILADTGAAVATVSLYRAFGGGWQATSVSD